ncbi:Fur family transcriptional regulator [uncultured Microbacterium sp.]|uniref:Fur family transcriptional regulator n=1 Tax=uncultured Microbacterium sp. TaxID=191216 RepID=UPI00261E7F1A|nr:Fur family transcriptional regulator [uncultured Microbacterium sp.]
MSTTHPIPSAEEMIRTAGLRVTQSRRAVLDALRDNPHASADDILAAVRPEVASTSVQSVYNALNDFAAAGLVRRIEPAGHPMLFELRVDDNHHHLVCTVCGAVRDVECAVGHAPCLTPSHDHGFRIAAAEVTYWGICAGCADAAS